MFFIKKSKKSKARFFVDTSRYFSYKKHSFFTFYYGKNHSRNNTGKISMSCKRRKFKNLDVVINYARTEMSIKNTVMKVSFWKKKKPYVMLVKSKYNSLSYYIAPELFFVGKIIRNLPLEKETYINNYRTFELRKLGYLVLLSILKTNDKIFNLLSSLKILYKIALSAGTYFKILYKSYCNTFYVILAPSGLEIKVSVNSIAVLGKNSNSKNYKKVIGSAGINFFNGVNPRVRGVAMNPVDHPNGGRTKTPKPEKSPWGWVAKLKK